MTLWKDLIFAWVIEISFDPATIRVENRSGRFGSFTMRGKTRSGIASSEAGAMFLTSTKRRKNAWMNAGSATWSKYPLFPRQAEETFRGGDAF